MKVEYVGGAFAPGVFPEQKQPEVCFVGRSNVGKSSLINTLCNQRQLARVSRTPGRTQAIHFFRVGSRVCLVDLPGYGYAKAPGPVRKAWKPLIDSYIDTRHNLVMGVLLVDCRRDPRDEELALIARFKAANILSLVVVTKVDKLAKTRQSGRVQQLAKQLGVTQAEAVGFSATARTGREELWRRINEAAASGKTRER